MDMKENIINQIKMSKLYYMRDNSYDDDEYSEEISDSTFLEHIIIIPNFIKNLFVQEKLKQIIIKNNLIDKLKETENKQ